MTATTSALDRLTDGTLVHAFDRGEIKDELRAVIAAARSELAALVAERDALKAALDSRTDDAMHAVVCSNDSDCECCNSLRAEMQKRIDAALSARAASGEQAT